MKSETLDKKIGSELWKLSYPTMISIALQSFYDIVDMMWVGKIDKSAVAGVTIFSTVFWLFTFFNDVVGMGSISMISQSWGRKDESRTRRVCEQTISFKVFMALISGVCFYFFLDPVLRLYTNDPDVLKAANDYGYIRIFFLPITFASYSVNTIFRNTNNVKLPMKIMVVSAILNFVLDPILMFKNVPYIGIPGFGLGVFGAALATVIVTTFSFSVGLYILVSGKSNVNIRIRGLFSLDPKIDRQLLIVGLPSGIEVLLRYLSQAIVMKFVTVYSTDAVSAAGIGSKLYGLFFMPISGMVTGGSAMVGMFLGKEQPEMVHELVKIMRKLNLTVMGVISILTYFFAEQLMRIFIESPEVVNTGATMLRINSIGLMAAALALAHIMVFTGSGFTHPLLYGSTAGRWFAQIPFLFMVVSVFHAGLPFVWCSNVITEAVNMFVLIFYYNKGMWKYRRV